MLKKQRKRLAREKALLLKLQQSASIICSLLGSNNTTCKSLQRQVNNQLVKVNKIKKSLKTIMIETKKVKGKIQTLKPKINKTKKELRTAKLRVTRVCKSYP